MPPEAELAIGPVSLGSPTDMMKMAAAASRLKAAGGGRRFQQGLNPAKGTG